MRPGPSAGQGGEHGSPHINRMEGDLSKIKPLGLETINGNYRNRKENCDLTTGQLWQHSLDHEHDTFAPKNNSPSSLGVLVSEGSEADSSVMLPRSTWSNIVSTGTYNLPSNTNNVITESSSGETLAKSNEAQHPSTSDHFNQRSHSFPENESRFDLCTPDLSKSPSFDESSPSSARNSQTSPWGLPPTHTAPLSYKDVTTSQPHSLPTIQQGVQSPATPLHSPMMNCTPHSCASREHKPRSNPPSVSYSPISLSGLSEATDQTSPMSSPSLSPHMAPLQLPKTRSQIGGSMSPGPPMYTLNSDGNDFHSDQAPSSHHTQFHPRPPQSVPEYHRQSHANQACSYHYAYATPHPQHTSHDEQSYHSSLALRPFNSSHASPPKHPHTSTVSHHPQSMQARRPGSKHSPGPLAQGSMSRSATEVLKTLLRKKACLYEPETSFAISLVTWLVGRRLALAHGYFTRQQLQSGVHSCVADKIKEGHVTRTKVNRCMQIILNSCFHYIIPRPDGSEESGEAFRSTFLSEVADDEYLLHALPIPWNDLTLNLLDLSDKHSHSSYDSDNDVELTSLSKNPVKTSSLGNHGAGDSVDSGGKRAVLLCFNENVRCADDVFRCHNEFIRDVAHSANLTLSPEEWRSFFSGSKGYRKRSVGHDNAASRYFQKSGGSAISDSYDCLDQQGLSKFRTSWCAKRYDHDQTLCSFAHTDINRGWLRRDPSNHSYKPIMCQNVKPLANAENCYINSCALGVRCSYSHSREEILYHPEHYKRNQCNNHSASCPLRDICPNVHNSDSSFHQSPTYKRHGKSHGDHSPTLRGINSTSRKRSVNSTGHTGGFGRHPGGSPMLYVDPAPISEFEKTLLLPGLQALFRDHSCSIVNSSMKDKCFEYTLFGYKTRPSKIEEKLPLSSIQRRRRI